MKINKIGTTYEFIIEGSIGEGSPLFTHDIRLATRIVVNAFKMTYINSIGVKHWVLWASRIPSECQFVLSKAPLVMINQASTVVGFMPPGGVIESFFAPFACPECNVETLVPLTNGRDYRYSQAGQPRQIQLPESLCPKCKTEMEPDFIEAKVFSFLDQRSK